MRTTTLEEEGQQAMVAAGAEELLKVDARGRVRVSEKRREALLAEYDRGGLSGPEFAAHYGIKYQTLATWLQKRKRDAGLVAGAKPVEQKVEKVKWLEAVEDEAAGVLGGLKVELPGGGILRVEDAARLAVEGIVITPVSGHRSIKAFTVLDTFGNVLEFFEAQ